MVLAAAIAVARAGGSGTAGASERETFASCEELDDWMQSSQGAARTLPTTGFAIEDTDEAASASGDDSGGAGAEGSTESTSAAAAPVDGAGVGSTNVIVERSEEHTSELQSLMRISYAVFCLKKINDSNK